MAAEELQSLEYCNAEEDTGGEAYREVAFQKQAHSLCPVEEKTFRLKGFVKSCELGDLTNTNNGTGCWPHGAFQLQAHGLKPDRPVVGLDMGRGRPRITHNSFFPMRCKRT